MKSRQFGGGVLRRRDPVELGELQPGLEDGLLRVGVQSRRHEIREVLGPPYAAQAGVGVRVEQLGRACVLEVGESAGQHDDVGGDEVEEAFGRVTPLNAGPHPV